MAMLMTYYFFDGFVLADPTIIVTSSLFCNHDILMQLMLLILKFMYISFLVFMPLRTSRIFINSPDELHSMSRLSIERPLFYNCHEDEERIETVASSVIKFTTDPGMSFLPL